MADPVADDRLLDHDAEQIRFAQTLVQRAPHLSLRIESALDQSFLNDLFRRCSSLRVFLPPALLDMQAAAQASGHAARYPHAVRLIVLQGCVPIGRIAFDRQPGDNHLIDIAILPEARTKDAGLAVLRSWLALADADGDGCSLQVLRDAPVQRLYRRLGFEAVPDDGTAPALNMRRRPI